MRIAFYAPLKAPDHPVPSGDRRIGRALIQALRSKGHEVSIVSRLRSWDGTGDTARQRRIARRGATTAEALIAKYRSNPQHRPALWLTYHLYHKAPDWIGPAVTKALSIPYVVAEASNAPKQANGPWATGYEAARIAITQADGLIGLNSDDRAGLSALTDAKRVHALAPFIDTTPYAQAEPARSALAARYDLDDTKPWLLTVAMMRKDAKLLSYRVLAGAMRDLEDLEWQLVIAGDGPARAEVEALFARFPRARVRFLGALGESDLPPLYASADLYLWPAINEAFGMAFLEAQAAGLPVVAGRERGVPDVVRCEVTGLLVPPGDPAAFADAVAQLLRDEQHRHEMRRQARAIVGTEHDLGTAAHRLDEILHHIVTEYPR